MIGITLHRHFVALAADPPTTALIGKVRGNLIHLLMPLTISDALIGEGVGILADTLRELANAASSD